MNLLNEECEKEKNFTFQPHVNKNDNLFFDKRPFVERTWKAVVDRQEYEKLFSKFIKINLKIFFFFLIFFKLKKNKK